MRCQCFYSAVMANSKLDYSLTAPFLLLKIKIIRTRTLEKLVDHGFSFIGNRLSTGEGILYVPDCIELHSVKRKA